MPNDNPIILNNPIPDFDETFVPTKETVVNNKVRNEENIFFENDIQVILPEKNIIVDRKKTKK